MLERFAEEEGKGGGRIPRTRAAEAAMLEARRDPVPAQPLVAFAYQQPCVLEFSHDINITLVSRSPGPLTLPAGPHFGTESPPMMALSSFQTRGSSSRQDSGLLFPSSRSSEKERIFPL